MFDRVPFPASVATPGPFRRDCAAGLADISIGIFRHVLFIGDFGPMMQEGTQEGMQERKIEGTQRGKLEDGREGRAPG